MRLIGERRALASLGLVLFGVLYLLNAFLAPGPLVPLFSGLAILYLVGFFGVVAGWFWARWYAMGLGQSGVTMAALMAWQMGGIEPVVLIWGGIHTLVVLALFGQGPRTAFEGRQEWRARFRMDEDAVDKLGKTVNRAAISLPYLVMAGLAPKQSGLGLVFGLAALALGALGLRGLVRLRTLGLVGVGAAGLVALCAALWSPTAAVAVTGGFWGLTLPSPGVAAALAAVFALAAPLALARPMARALARTPAK